MYIRYKGIRNKGLVLVAVTPLAWRGWDFPRWRRRIPWASSPTVTKTWLLPRCAFSFLCFWTCNFTWTQAVIAQIWTQTQVLAEFRHPLRGELLFICQVWCWTCYFPYKVWRIFSVSSKCCMYVHLQLCSPCLATVPTRTPEEMSSVEFCFQRPDTGCEQEQSNVFSLRENHQGEDEGGWNLFRTHTENVQTDPVQHINSLHHVHTLMALETIQDQA